METSCDNSKAFVLEEVFQILLEILDHDPFSQGSSRSSKKYIGRLRQLLGQEFSFWLAETGNIFFATLTSTNKHAYELFSNSGREDIQIYDLLLNTSHLMMCLGPQSEKTINSLIKLQALTTDVNHLYDDISQVIELAILHLQNSVSTRIVV